MGFTTDGEGNGRLPDITAVITNVGIDYREYDSGDNENRLVVVWEPEGDVFSTQTEILSTYNILKVKPNKSAIRVGGSENGFDLEILGHIIIEGKLGYKASVWMDKLEELGVKVPSDSGNLQELIGVKAVLRQLTYNEVKGGEAGDREKPFWMPIEILPTTEKPPEDVVQDAEFTVVKDDLSAVPERSLHDAVNLVAPGMAEKELVEWYMKSVYARKDASVVPFYVVIEELLGEKLLKVQNGIYMRLGTQPNDSEVLTPNI